MGCPRPEAEARDCPLLGRIIALRIGLGSNPMAKPISKTGRTSTRRWKRQVVRFTFNTNSVPRTVAAWLQSVGACGVVRAVPGYERTYVLTLRRGGNMDYLETLLRLGECREVLTRE